MELVNQTKRIIDAAHSLYAPDVAAVCLSFARGEEVAEKELTRLLDGLLGFCFEEKMLELFRQLCRAAVEKFPQLVNDYVLAYKEMWEEE